MIVPLMCRRAAAVLLVAALAFAALPGCGNTAPSKAEAKKEEPKADPKKEEPKTDPKKDGKTDTQPIEVKSTLGPVEKAAEDTAEAFLKDLGHGTAKAESLSPAFLKAVGKPWELPDDTAKGVSVDAANRWLRHVGQGRTFSLSLDRKQAGDAIYWRGILQGQPGGYSLRLVKDAGAWKVDWLSLSSVDTKVAPATGAADDAFQEFAVTSFVEMLTDATAMEQKSRAPLIARGTVPALRAAWAPPFDGDKGHGYDYSPTKLGIKAIEYGGGTSAFSVAKAGDLTYNVELIKPAGKKTLVVKLVKGTTPGEWLVSEVIEAKG